MQTITGLIQEKTIKSGTTNGRDWTVTKYKVMNNWFGTFDKKYAGFQEDDDVTIEYDSTDKGHDITKMSTASTTKTSITKVPEDAAVYDVDVEQYVMITRERFLELAEQVKANPNKKTVLIRV